MDLLTIYAGTVGLAVLMLIAGVWMLTLAWDALTKEDEGDDRTARVLGFRPSGRVAPYGSGDHNSALLQVQQDLSRDLARRKREAAEVAIFKAVKRGQVGSPASGGPVPPAA